KVASLISPIKSGSRFPLEAFFHQKRKQSGRFQRLHAIGQQTLAYYKSGKTLLLQNDHPKTPDGQIACRHSSSWSGSDYYYGFHQGWYSVLPIQVGSPVICN